MATGSVITDNGKKIILNRTFKATPDYTAPSQFKVGTDTTTPDVSDTDLGAAVVISGGLYVKDLVSGYPTIDEGAFTATMRSLLFTTDANGNSITEYGSFNNDGTPKLFSRGVFTAISKTSTVQVIFVEKDYIE